MLLSDNRQAIQRESPGAWRREDLPATRASGLGAIGIKLSTRRRLNRQLELARDYLHIHSDRAVTLAEVASVARLSRFHLARRFKLAFGQAPIRYHRGLRLARAAQFLAAGAGSLAQAAEIAGYSDEVALSHAFRGHFGKAPRQWAHSRVEIETVAMCASTNEIALAES
jgi:transcriptional regulator GlxA family with amidase domain